jgi:ATP-binding cassette, subfamily B, bacterial
VSGGKSIPARVLQALDLRRAFQLVWQSAPGWTLASLGLVLVQGLLPLLGLWLMKLVVDAVTAAATAPDKAAALKKVLWLIGLAGAVALLTSLFRIVANLVNEIQVQVVTDHVADLLHGKSVQVDLAYYESPDYHDTQHRAQQEAQSRPPRIVRGLLQFGQSAVSLAAVAGLLLSLHWVMALILVAAAVPGALVRLRFSRKMYRWDRARTPLHRRAWYYHWLLSTDTPAKELRLFNLGALFRGRFRAIQRQLQEDQRQVSAQRSWSDFVTQALGLIAVFGCCGFIAWQAVLGAITLGSLVMYFQAFQRGQGFLQDLLTSLGGLYEDNLFLTSLYEFLDLPAKVLEPKAPKPFPPAGRCGVVFDQVCFQYEPETRPALDNVNLTIRPGEHIALVGDNGSGKTTLTKLLCRLYDPTRGRITVGGVDLREFSIPELRQQMSVIFQDHFRYHLTARENIAFGRPESDLDEALIVAAARQSGAAEVVGRLPRGYDTVLGNWFEQGEELSVGEWQKVALARAFLREARILVLDEPTSALDAQSEAEVFGKFRQLAAGRTAILISHRFSTVRAVDCIHVLGQGRIIESGDHDSLMRRGGRYAEMFELQARNYR